MIVRGGGGDLDEDADTGDMTDFGPDEDGTTIPEVALETKFEFADWLKARSGTLNMIKEKANDKYAGITAKIKTIKDHNDKEEWDKARDASKVVDLDMAKALKAIKDGPVVKAPDQPPSSAKKPTGVYLKRKAQVSVQLESAKKRGGLIGTMVTQGMNGAEALSLTDDEGAARRLTTLVKEVQELLQEERRKFEQRLEELVDKATRIRLELNPDHHAVEATVRDLLRNWDFDTAKATLDAFEKAIEKARPVDFVDINIIQERRVKELRKEREKFARNTEQALMAAKRIVDDQGNLLVDEPFLKGLPFIRTDDLASVAEELADTEDSSMPHSVHALEMLKRLQTDKATQEALKTVKAPPDPNTGTTEDQKQSLKMAQSLIRNTLGLPENAVISDADAKRAAIAALLAQACNG